RTPATETTVETTADTTTAETSANAEVSGTARWQRLGRGHLLVSRASPTVARPDRDRVRVRPWDGYSRRLPASRRGWHGGRHGCWITCTTRGRFLPEILVHLRRHDGPARHSPLARVGFLVVDELLLFPLLFGGLWLARFRLPLTLLCLFPDRSL